MLPLIHRIQLIPMSSPFIWDAQTPHGRGRKKGKGEGDRIHRAGETQQPETKIHNLWMGMGEVQAWERPSVAPLPPLLLTQEGGNRRMSIGTSVCPTQGLLPSFPTWSISHLSGPSLTQTLSGTQVAHSAQLILCTGLYMLV